MITSNYTLDISEFREEGSPIHVTCRADKVKDRWECFLDLEDDLHPREIKAIKKVLKPLFFKELEEKGITNYHWVGDKESPLLQFNIGDPIKYNGEECIVVYILPDKEKCGLKSSSGRLLNNVCFSEIAEDLLKKGK